MRSTSRPAILERPFFDPKADAAFNYGAIGAVIGHEISHSFDNNGALFDSTGPPAQLVDAGRLRSASSEAGQALAAQYDAYEALPGLNVNGKLTLGENIADVAGLAAAYDAYKALAGRQGSAGDRRLHRRPALLHRLCPEPGRPRCARRRCASAIATDGHAPGQFRALTVRNLDAWYTAFNVQPGQKLYLAPEKRVKVW